MHLKFQNPSIHGSNDMRGLKSVSYGRTDKPTAICPPNFEPPNFFKVGGINMVNKNLTKNHISITGGTQCIFFFKTGWGVNVIKIKVYLLVTFKYVFFNFFIICHIQGIRIL